MKRYVIYLCACLVTLLAISRANSEPEVPVIGGTFTLAYDVTLNKEDPSLVGIGFNYEKPSRVTVSSDGSKVLWRMVNGSWSYTIIYDPDSKTSYTWCNSGVNAEIHKGNMGWATADMRYVPFPGTSLGCFSLLTDVRCPARGPCTGMLLSPGGFVGDREPSYVNATVNYGTWEGHDVLDSISCSGDNWKFEGYELFNGVPIAGRMAFGHIAVGRGDHQSMVEAEFKLVKASSAPLPERSYNLASYLQANLNSVDDFSSKVPISYWFDPKLGDFGAQRDVEQHRESQLLLMAKYGSGPDRTRTGILALLAGLAFIAYFVFAAITRRRKLDGKA
ncbi:MAG: hypothetical protein ACLQVD_18760 [Capsulimonadaceae bacterium]